MSRLRNAPLEVRRAYQRALAALPAKSTVVFPPKLDTLTTVGAAIIDDRTLVFGVHGGRPRLWITTDSAEGPNLLGHLSGLVNETPDLWICDYARAAAAVGADGELLFEKNIERVWHTAALGRYRVTIDPGIDVTQAIVTVSSFRVSRESKVPTTTNGGRRRSSERMLAPHLSTAATA